MLFDKTNITVEFIDICFSDKSSTKVIVVNIQFSRRSELMYKLRHVKVESIGIVPVFLAYKAVSIFRKCYFSYLLFQ